MGIYDRDYYRESTGTGFGGFQMWSITTRLILINVAVFFLDGMLDRLGLDHPLTRWGDFTIVDAVFHLEIWRFITFQFLHASPQHIFFNMLGLYFFGPIVESYLGDRRYLLYYLACGAAGAAMYMLLSAANVIHSVDGFEVPLVGASAGIFGVLVAAAKVAPGMNIYVLLTFPIPIRVLVGAYLAMALYQVITSGDNAGGEAAHLGGAVLGLALIFNPHWLNIALYRRPKLRYGGKRVRFKDWRNDMNR
jgi:membrane associated rhomboid family serine protease